MNKYILVRHGQDEDNEAGILNGRRDMSLTDKGREQAAEAGEQLLDKNIDLIIASPLTRTQQTARIIADTIGITDVVTEELLIERDFGVLTGKPIADIPKLADRILETDQVNYFLEVENAETFPQSIERGQNLLAQLNAQYQDKTIVLVTHGDIGKMIRAAYYGWDYEKGLKTPYFANTEAIEL